MPRVIWSSGNCMLYVRAEPSASEKERERGEPRGESASEEGWKRARRKEFAKNRGSFGYRQKSLVMVVEEDEQKEDEDDDVEEAREKEQGRGERRGAVPRRREVEGRREGEDGEDARGDVGRRRI